MSNLDLVDSLQAIVVEQDDNIINKDKQLNDSIKQIKKNKSRETFLLILISLLVSLLLVLSLVLYTKYDTINDKQYQSEEEKGSSLVLQLKEASIKIKEYSNIIDSIKSNETSSSLMIKVLLSYYTTIIIILTNIIISLDVVRYV
jgi:predicted PurR-regulated permease PerM